MAADGDGDLTGRVFGRLTVAGPVAGAGASRRWRCRCACGAAAVVRARHLTTGQTRSCGCLRRETSGARLRRHGRYAGAGVVPPGGEGVPLAEACRRAGVAYTTVLMRRDRGWPEERWLLPPRARGRRKRRDGAGQCDQPSSRAAEHESP